TRHNCNPGGSTVGNGCNGPTPAVGGTIDHIGTTGSAGSFTNCSWNGGTNTATCTWDVAQVINQSGVRFKIRALDAAGNVIDAAGGDSANFTLLRNHPTAAFINPNFVSTAVHAGGTEPDTFSTVVSLPANVGDYETVYMLGSYFGNPIVSMNGRTYRPFDQGNDDFWVLSKIELLSNRVYGGNNEIQYSWATANSFGQFIETPGPMIILRDTTDGFVDSAAPVVTEFAPADGSVDVDPDVPVTFNLEDGFGVGVDYTSIQLRINGNLVSPKISGFSNRYAVTYSPNGGFPTSTPIAVAIDAKDLAGNVLQTTYNFTTEPPDFTPPVISGVSLIPNAKRLTVRWNTDELADSSFDFGVTTSYTRTVSDANLTTAHELIITDLTPSTTYHYRIRSADKDGNGASTPDATFTTPALADLVSDDFNYCSDNDPRWDKWQFVDPLGDATYSLDGETLTISVPGDVEHNVWKDGTPLIRAPHLLQDAS
ncbi:MAG: Ig-like domain-containing protein, partial [Caldilineaceae bacterium]|nr:Ig-like domain-containing protein [Caldilineaceae bacterium]